LSGSPLIASRQIRVSVGSWIFAIATSAPKAVQQHLSASHSDKETGSRIPLEQPHVVPLLLAVEWPKRWRRTSGVVELCHQHACVDSGDRASTIASIARRRSTSVKHGEEPSRAPSHDILDLRRCSCDALKAQAISRNERERIGPRGAAYASGRRVQRRCYCDGRGPECPETQQRRVQERKV
jgi:hypothetical protein